MNRITLAATLILLLTAPARAQFVVHDPGNLAQAILIAERTLREYHELLAQYQTIERMSQGLGNMDAYRLPVVPMASHDVGRWEYGRPWLQGLNAGDATGAAYSQTARRLERPVGALQQLPPAARRAVENAYATVEITDSVAQMAGHQVGLVRGYSSELQRTIDALEGDVVNTGRNPQRSARGVTHASDQTAYTRQAVCPAHHPTRPREQRGALRVRALR